MTIGPSNSLGLWLALAAASAGTAVSAAICSTTGSSAPEVLTLMASTKNPANEAWIVAPDCTVNSQALETDDGPPGSLLLNNYDIEQVLSVPTDATAISMGGSPLSRSADFSMATKAQWIELSGVPTDIDKLTLPPAIETITFTQRVDALLPSLDGIKFPSTLTYIAIGASKIKSLKNVQFPASIESLFIKNTPLKTLDFQLPPALKYLSFDAITTSSFAQLERLTLPSGLRYLGMVNSGTASFRGVKWPTSLETLDLRNTPVSAFEIRRSDVAIFSKLTSSESFKVTVEQTTCSGSATLERVAGVNLCVISDADFEKLYSASAPPGSDSLIESSLSTTTVSNPDKSKNSVEGDGSSNGPSLMSTTVGPSRGSASRSPSTAPRGELDETSTPTLADDEPPSNDTVDDSTGTASSWNSSKGSPSTRSPNSASNSSSTNGFTTSMPRNSLSPTQSPEGSPITSGTSHAASRTSLTVIILACALSCIVGGIVYHVLVRSKQRQQQDAKLVHDMANGQYSRAETPTASIDAASITEPQIPPTAMPQLEALRALFMSDQDLVRCRMDQVQIGPAIAEGGSGVVHRGSYQGRSVAVKQLPVEAWESNSTVEKFLDEVRLCARLNHPKIVEFIGVTWSGGRDLAAVSEFMAGGDLKTVLQKHPSSTGNEWAAPWTPNQLRSKTLIALDVIEAVVYLHSYNPPIIHRDLKAKNVLLDTKGNAKLSDFGISREMSIDQTMTSDVGTAAWIAPEVLRGERYSEKADIYSLGVLLVELDRCTHPYANEPKLMMDSAASGDGGIQASTGMVAHKNTQIAVLVSTGQLRPSSSAQCPEDVTQLAARCLNYEANERPTAMEAFYQLRQIRKLQQSGHTRATSHFLC